MVVDSTEDVPPIVEPVAMEVQSPVVDQTNAVNTGGGSYPPLPTHETHSAGNASGKGNGIDVVVSVEYIRAISERFANTAYGFFLGKRVAYPVVANYVRNTWSKYGLVRSMFSSSTGLFSSQFTSMDGLDAMLENGPWFIRNNPLILKKWHPDENLLKEDVNNIPVWVKLHGVPVTAFSDDGLSAIATKLELRRRATIRIIFMLSMSGTCCMVFGHVHEECPKNIGAGATKTLKKTSQTPKGILVGQKMGFKPKQVFQPVSKKSTANTRGKMNNPESTKEVSNSNPFEVLTSVDNDVDLGKLRFVDDDGNSFVPMGIMKSDSEVEVVFDETANLRISTSGKDGSDKGYGTNSLLEQ
ncbi:zinc finger, CCHC-type containing protein [Tanacetum coccineum]